jgi:DNA-directed RNA polymerase subunit beta'
VKDKILLTYGKETLTTTVGRVIFNSIIPEKLRFMNSKVKNKDLKKILSKIFDVYDMETTVDVADAIKDFGFKYSTIAATSINVLEMTVPEEKEEELRK